MAGAALVALALLPGAGTWARGRVLAQAVGHEAARPVARATPEQGAAAQSGPGSARGFSHAVHRVVSCTSCHVSGSSHGALKVRTREDCVGCHHGRTRATGCTTCHTASTLPAPGQRSVQVRTSVAAAPSTRTLPFAHAFHGSVACGDCHGPGPEHKTVKDCTGCHERHHTAARDCRQCHRPEDVKGHPASGVHAGCAGGGCHGDKAVTSLSWSRTVCTGCHQDRAKHGAGRECATCHQVPALHTDRKEVTP
ncbi:MAG TPA: cytochrome c3 family protein [Longimicrobiales bacterium]